jgi:hypothetical protein
MLFPSYLVHIEYQVRRVILRNGIETMKECINNGLRNFSTSFLVQSLQTELPSVLESCGPSRRHTKMIESYVVKLQGQKYIHHQLSKVKENCTVAKIHEIVPHVYA